MIVRAVNLQVRTVALPSALATAPTQDNRHLSIELSWGLSSCKGSEKSNLKME
jgi:hypothetical protein